MTKAVDAALAEGSFVCTLPFAVDYETKTIPASLLRQVSRSFTLTSPTGENEIHAAFCLLAMVELCRIFIP
jgi:hypothetical protein